MKKFLSVLALGVISAMANARQVAYDFSGTFDATSRYSGDEYTQEPPFLDLVKAGDTFSGSFTFDSDAISSTGGGPGYLMNTYYLKNFQLTASAPFNAAFTSWNNPVVGIRHYVGQNGDTRDELNFLARATTPGHALDIRATFYVPANTFADFNIPDKFDQFSDGSASMFMFHYEGADFVIDSGTGSVGLHLNPVSPVPEPSSALMMLAALASIGGAATLRRRRG